MKNVDLKLSTSINFTRCKHRVGIRVGIELEKKLIANIVFDEVLYGELSFILFN